MMAKLFHYCLMLHAIFARDLINDNYTVHYKKYLNSKISIHTTRSVLQCLMLCSMTDGCYAANVHGNDEVLRELTSGLRNAEEMLEDSTKAVYIRDNDKCTDIVTNLDSAKILDPVRDNGQPPDFTVWQVSMVTDVSRPLLNIHKQTVMLGRISTNHGPFFCSPALSAASCGAHPEMTVQGLRCGLFNVRLRRTPAETLWDLI